MDIGIAAPKCKCVHGCEKGVEPMTDCICKLEGDVRTARCEAEGGTTWHVNGSCLSCTRKAFHEKKERMAKRHAEIMSAPANPVDLSNVDLDKEMEEFKALPSREQRRIFVPNNEEKARIVEEAPVNSTMELVLRIGGVDLTISRSVVEIERMLRAK